MVALCVVKYEKCRTIVVLKNHRTLYAKKPPISYKKGGFLGMSGDTELFENPSNIKGLWASEQKIILYIPLF